MKDQELEVKFFLRDLPAVEERLRSLGASQTQPRTHEQNLRFDTPQKDLARTFRVLRLRHDMHSYLTFKGPAETVEGVRVRKEIQFVVENFQAAWQLLLEIGFQVSIIYEKYRTVYDLNGVSISLDELPYGSFVEIEGPDPTSIHEVNTALGLDWETRIPDSYIVLFEQLRSRKGWDFRDLIFENFTGWNITAADLQVSAADD